MSTRTGPQWQVTATPPAAPQAAPAADGRTPAPAPLTRNTMPNAREAFDAAQQFRALQQQQRAAPAMPEWMQTPPPAAAPSAQPPAQAPDFMQAFIAQQAQAAQQQAQHNAMLMQILQRQQAPAAAAQPQQQALPSPRAFGFDVEPEQEEALQRYFAARDQAILAPVVGQLQQVQQHIAQQNARERATEQQRTIGTQIDQAMAAVRLGPKHRQAIQGLVMQGVAPEQAVRQHIEAWQESLKQAPAPQPQPGQHYVVQPWAAHQRTDDLSNGAGGSQFTEVAPFQVDSQNGTKDLKEGLLAMLSAQSPIGRG